MAFKTKAYIYSLNQGKMQSDTMDDITVLGKTQITPEQEGYIVDYKGVTTGISFIDKNDLVFSNNEGKLRTYSGIRVMFDRLMKQNGLENYHFHFHTLRHTYSSMLFESRENPKVIQMLLGHKDVTTTIRTYNSVDRSYFKQATAKLEEKFKSDIPED